MSTSVVTSSEPIFPVNRRPPISILIGLSAAVVGTALWATEQLTGAQAFEILSMPAKLILLLAFPFSLPAISVRFRANPRSAVYFATAAIAATVAAAAAYLPWRDSFCHHFNNGVYRWYWSGLLAESSGYYGDFDAWLAG